MGKSGKGERCAKAGCKGWAMHDGSGLCSGHNPAREELRREQLIKMAKRSKERVPEGNCAVEGCRGWAVRDGSGLCRGHNPNFSEKRIEMGFKIAKSKRTNKPPPERKCKVKGCKSWNMLDGSGLCWTQKPETINRRHTWLNGKKFAKGHHNPWLGLANIEEARGLIFYSLETDQPLLTLRALKKIASLHANGLMGGGESKTGTESNLDQARINKLLHNLINSIKPDDYDVQGQPYIEAAFSLALLGDTAAASKYLHKLLKADEAFSETYLAAFYLAQLGDPSGYPAMLKCLHSEDDHTRTMAARYLIGFKPYDGQAIAGGTVNLKAEYQKLRKDPSPYVKEEIPGLMKEAGIK